MIHQFKLEKNYEKNHHSLHNHETLQFVRAKNQNFALKMECY